VRLANERKVVLTEESKTSKVRLTLTGITSAVSGETGALLIVFSFSSLCYIAKSETSRRK
jgi:hypothetical protein